MAVVFLALYPAILWRRSFCLFSNRRWSDHDHVFFSNICIWFSAILQICQSFSLCSRPVSGSVPNVFSFCLDELLPFNIVIIIFFFFFTLIIIIIIMFNTLNGLILLFNTFICISWLKWKLEPPELYWQIQVFSRSHFYANMKRPGRAYWRKGGKDFPEIFKLSRFRRGMFLLKFKLSKFKNKKGAQVYDLWIY